MVSTTTRNPQANGVIELLHRVIGDKMRTQEINTASDWEVFLHNVTFALRASHHSMLNASPAQAAFGRDMIADIVHKTDWAEQYQRKLDQIARNNKRENAKRRDWKYAPGDRVLLKNDAGVQPKMAPLYSGPYEVIAVRENGTLVLDKGRYIETLHIRPVVPVKSQRGEECQQDQDL
ncbi:hypothetical protein PHYSODRAFT_306621 [Phytophthora sojae]|uniref:Integrase catalytic domain-containing protein n=1 Tax=Phytophthora sojae (strain P6497) TaxID=1094619 RepID=G5AA20_PHYSP|nr:hypothetical protein PHYSODRAFT_306621 [Phytophthora sojae]EGZ07449.1 hypothetical protein PHYSODRAFT_306621 [Phytophthora sojae]|eukprot:XP_009537015.1 hypothetical protein PHYSODRAFT_306621 [Phytophthora sojae]